MTANEVIESYVNEVALQVPRRQRNDVALELGALLREGLEDRAEAAGRDADATMAVEFLNAFGRPEDVAARYRPALTVIDPADGPRFVRLTWIGLVIIWGASLLEQLGQPDAAGGDALMLISRWWWWWIGTVLSSLWWPGVLVTWFALSAWTQRRWPPAADWKPRAKDRLDGGRAALLLGMVGVVLGCVVLANPTLLLDVVWQGRAAPAAYTALTYDPGFLQRQAPWLFALVLSNLPLMAVALVMGRHPAWLRRLETVFSLVTCAVMLWVVFDGPVLVTPAGDTTAKFLLLVIAVVVLLYLAVSRFRQVRPKATRTAVADPRS
jgi:hypothetical protein